MSDTMTMNRRRVIAKSDLLTLLPPGRDSAPIVVRVSMEKGSISLKSQEKQRPSKKEEDIFNYRTACLATTEEKSELTLLQQTKVNFKESLKIVWVNDLIDDEVGQIKNCFVIVTPEQNFILQGDSHRAKIDWMQSLSIAISQTLQFRGSYRPSNWSNLNDLNKWLMIRDVDYQFVKHPVFKGAVYSGKWHTGMPHIYGKMNWPNGDRYDGEFVYGQFEGTGTMMWLSSKQYRHYTGSWRNGVMEGHGEMIFADQSVYTGWWQMGMRHGHGRMEYKHSNDVFVGGWKADKRCGYGILDNKSKSERYLGMWEDDKHQGAGIQVAKNKYQFSGNFINGQRSYNVTGSMRRRSISVIQDHKWDSLFKCTSAYLEYMVNFAHRDNPTTTLGGCTSSSRDDTHVHTPKSVITDVDSAVAMDFNEASPTSSDWDTGAVASCKKLGPRYSSCSNCPGHYGGEDEGNLEETCTVCRIEGFKSAEHPLGLLVNSLTRCFTESYSGVAVHANLLPHAISELCSITSRIHILVKKHCPSLITTDENMIMGRPKTQLSMLMKSKKKVLRKTSYYEPLHADPSWLYPIILPSIFPTLFALYKEHYSRDDFKIGLVISRLDQRSDEELSEILGVRSEFEFWEKMNVLSLSDSSHNKQSRSNMAQFSDYFQRATGIFQTISDYMTPQNKLLCMQEVDGELVQLLSSLSAKRNNQRQRPSQSSDGEKCSSREGDTQSDSEEGDEDASDGSVLTGAFTFIIIRSRVKHLYSEIQFIQDFSGSTLLTDEFGFLLAKLRDSYYQLLELEL